jgi:two-component system nitrate/nitrite response regulator NarL
MPTDDTKIARIGTAVVAASVLTRAGLRSLLEKHVYHVLGTAGTVEQLLLVSPTDKPRLVLIAPESLDDLAAQAAACRHHWPDTHIVGIYDCSDAGDDDRVRASSINGCVSTRASERSLLGLLDLLVRDDEDLYCVLQPRSRAARAKHLPLPLSEPAPAPAHGEGISVVINGNGVHAARRNGLASYVREDEIPVAPAETRSRRNVPKLSDRERQVLEGIVRGLQNKMIARTYGITEATVKVHMKSILRKIQVHNRTQAAVWAMGQDASICTALEQRLFVPEPDRPLHED